MPDLKLPEFVEVCPCCNKSGETEQTFNAGCGMGYYRSMGSCPMCGKREMYGRPGPGFIYKATCEPVGASVVEQIRSMNA